MTTKWSWMRGAASWRDGWDYDEPNASWDTARRAPDVKEFVDAVRLLYRPTIQIFKGSPYGCAMMEFLAKLPVLRCADRADMLCADVVLDGRSEAVSSYMQDGTFSALEFRWRIGREDVRGALEILLDGNICYGVCVTLAGGMHGWELYDGSKDSIDGSKRRRW